MASIKPVSFTTGGSDYAADQAEILRQQKMAEMLQQQAQQPLDPNRMAGGWAIPISPWEGAAKLAQGAVGGIQAARAEKRQRDLAERMQQDAVNWYGQQPQARPASVPGFGGEPEQPTGGMQQPTAQERMAWLLRGQMNPLTAPMSGAMFAQQMRGPSWKEASIRQPDGQVRKGYVDINSPNPEATFRPLGTEPVKQEFVANQPVNPYTRTTPVADPNALMGLGPDGKPVVNQPLVDVKKDISKAGAASMNVSVSTDKGYLGEVASGLAKQDVAAINAAKGAPQRIESARRVKTLLDSGAITGTAAEWRTAAQKALVTAGVMDGKTVATTEQLGSSLASQTLDAIATSGLGSGQGFTDKDRQFLEKAKAGTLDMNRDSLRALADLNERAAVESIKRGNDVIKRLKKSKQSGEMGAGLQEIEVPSSGPADKPQISDKTRKFLRSQGITVD